MLRGRLLATSSFDQETVRIGRTPDNHVFIDNPVFSRSQAAIRKTGILYVLQDLESQNGTFLNGQRVKVANLNDGDRITVGKFTLVFSCPELAGVATRPLEQAGGGAATLNLDPRARAADLERHSQTRALLTTREGEEYPLRSDVFLIGFDRTCDFLVGGWRVPRLAMIARGYGGFSLVNVAGHDVSLNGTPVEWQAWLRDGDALTFAGHEARFMVEKDGGVRHAPEEMRKPGEALHLAIERSERRSKLLGLLGRWFDDRNT